MDINGALVICTIENFDTKMNDTDVVLNIIDGFTEFDDVYDKINELLPFILF